MPSGLRVKNAWLQWAFFTRPVSGEPRPPLKKHLASVHPKRPFALNGAGHRGSSSHGEQRGRSELARRAARQARLAAPPAAPEAGARRRSHWLSLSGAAQAASLHSSTRLLPARATQLSAARPAMRGSRSAAPTTAPEAGARWPRHWLSQSGAAQAASLHFSARLLPARATQL